MSYIGHQQTRELAQAPPNLTTDHSVKFEGESTAKAAYKAWQIPPRHQRKLAVYVPTEGEYKPVSTYQGAFIPKTAGTSKLTSALSPSCTNVCPQ
jgi:hypothetical protein